MKQQIFYWDESKECSLFVPAADNEVMDGVKWGDCFTLFTPAYWYSQFKMQPHASNQEYRKKSNLVDEVVFCLLGGFGITAEMSSAVFDKCKHFGLLEKMPSDEKEWLKVLGSSFLIDGSTKRYRYPNQKSRYLAGAMQFLKDGPFNNLEGKPLRDELLNVPGVGAKTAGWIVRNHTNTDDVAILDIHIHRAGVIAGFFDKNDDIQSDYYEMEERFLTFCKSLGVKPSLFDYFLWDQMRLFGRIAINAYNEVIIKNREITY
ncbi:8-oxoguanine DNA glycosylase [Salinivibrio kushneri]|nr:8-oxoguanine DNA glycosylase [Salinivibrio kushneri]